MVSDDPFSQTHMASVSVGQVDARGAVCGCVRVGQCVCRVSSERVQVQTSCIVGLHCLCSVADQKSAA